MKLHVVVPLLFWLLWDSLAGVKTVWIRIRMQLVLCEQKLCWRKSMRVSDEWKNLRKLCF
jgi:hypothetical protein